MDNSQIAARIKNKCKEKRISINQLTKDCGFGKNLINDMETKNTSPSVDKIITIANYLQCSINYLLEVPEKAGYNNGDNSTQTIGNGNNVNSTIGSCVDGMEKEMIDEFKKLKFGDKVKVINLIAELNEKGA